MRGASLRLPALDKQTEKTQTPLRVGDFFNNICAFLPSRPTSLSAEIEVPRKARSGRESVVSTGSWHCKA